MVKSSYARDRVDPVPKLATRAETWTHLKTRELLHQFIKHRNPPGGGYRPRMIQVMTGRNCSDTGYFLTIGKHMKRVLTALFYEILRRINPGVNQVILAKGK